MFQRYYFGWGMWVNLRDEEIEGRELMQEGIVIIQVRLWFELRQQQQEWMVGIRKIFKGLNLCNGVRDIDDNWGF